jgi:transcriptional regulator NrdR family protein
MEIMEVWNLTYVIKGNGQRELFDADKISMAIEKVIKDMGLNIENKKALVDTVTINVAGSIGMRNEIKTSEIQDKVLNEIEKIDQSISDAWKRFYRGHMSI